MARIVVVGGGWAGVGAALAARYAGAEVVLLERTDMLLGTGLVGGIIRNNGRWTATAEHIALGMGELWDTIDQNLRHRNVEFPGHKHADLYDVSVMEPAIRALLQNAGVQIHTQARVVDAKRGGDAVSAVLTEQASFEGDVFVETTGSAGPQNNCTKFGNGCSMCILRCPTFGGRVSLAARLGVPEWRAKRMDGNDGVMSGSCKLHFDSVSPEIQQQLREKGVAVIPLPPHLREHESRKNILGTKACQQYALPEFAENVVLLDTGHVKLMAPFFPLHQLRSIPGLEKARFEDPYSGGVGNSIRFLAMSPRDDTLQVEGVDNLFCAGEKAGPLVGHTEAVMTGSLAGHNAVRKALGLPLLTIPRTLALGELIATATEVLKTQDLTRKLTFSGASFFEHMKEKNLYTLNTDAIGERVAKTGLAGVFRQPLRR